MHFSILALEELQCSWTRTHFKTPKISSSNNQRHHHTQQPEYDCELIKLHSLSWGSAFRIESCKLKASPTVLASSAAEHAAHQRPELRWPQGSSNYRCPETRQPPQQMFLLTHR